MRNLTYSVFFSKNFPCVKLFSYKGDFLIYDAKPNFAFVINENELNFLIDLLSGDYEKFSKDKCFFENDSDDKLIIGKLKELIYNGVFIKGPIDTISPVNYSEIRNLLEYYDKSIILRKMTIELTEDCNLRCKYCPNTIETKNRKHSNLYMSQEIADKAVDFYFDRYTKLFLDLPIEKRYKIQELAPPCIAFYGGEPLLNFNVLKSTYDYFFGKDWGKYNINKSKLIVFITTNLTHLSDEIIQFIVDRNIYITVSIDGDKLENDKNRIDKQGNGSFDKVIMNLNRIKKYSSEYYKNFVSISSVETENHNIEQCRNFTEKLGVKSVVRNNAGFKGVFIPKYILNKKNSNESLSDFAEKVKSLSWDTTNLVVKDIIVDLLDFDNINFDLPQGSNYLNISITCPLTFDNIMVASDGKFHICHKTDCSYPLGDVFTGVNMQELEYMYASYNNTINNDNCKNCWMIRFCKFCAADRMNDKNFVNPIVEECSYLKMDCERRFQKFIELQNNNENIWNELIKYRIYSEDYRSIVDINKI